VHNILGGIKATRSALTDLCQELDDVGQHQVGSKDGLEKWVVD
jgi:hypothetical protein